MAIPFNLPTSQETDESYRLFDQFLTDLFDMVGTILGRRARRQNIQEILLEEENTVTARANNQRIQPDLIADVTLSTVSRVGVCDQRATISAAHVRQRDR